MSDEYDAMSREELLIRAKDWRQMANDRSAENGRLRAMVAKMWYTDAPFVTADGIRLLTPDEERLAAECVVIGWREADQQEAT